MGNNKKNTKDVAPKYKGNSKKPKKFPKIRRHVHQNSDTILIFLHSLFPLAIGGYLIYQDIPNDPPKSYPYFDYLGVLTGIVAILLHLTMIARTLASRCGAKFMNWLMLSVDLIQFFVCSVGSIVTLVYTGKEHIAVVAISLTNIVFCILPAFLAVTSLMNAPENSETQFSISNTASYASGRVKPAVIIRRIPDNMSDSSRRR
nr:expressed conserved protein [Hymenolepis microstoma]